MKQQQDIKISWAPSVHPPGIVDLISWAFIWRGMGAACWRCLQPPMIEAVQEHFRQVTHHLKVLTKLHDTTSLKEWWGKFQTTYSSIKLALCNSYDKKRERWTKIWSLKPDEHLLTFCCRRLNLWKTKLVTPLKIDGRSKGGVPRGTSTVGGVTCRMHLRSRLNRYEYTCWAWVEVLKVTKL